MLQEKLTALKDFILLKNTYYDRGYDNAVMDDSTGQINDGDTTLFPQDDLGNYFYFRLPNTIIPDYQVPTISDNYHSIGVKYDVILVALFEEGDNSLMAENLITTLGRYDQEQLKITRILIAADSIIFQELAKIPKEDLQAALRNFPENTGICSIHFSFTIPFVFQQLNCLQVPCKPC